LKIYNTVFEAILAVIIEEALEIYGDINLYQARVINSMKPRSSQSVRSPWPRENL
jgi:hypothetical protein